MNKGWVIGILVISLFIINFENVFACGTSGTDCCIGSPNYCNPPLSCNGYNKCVSASDPCDYSGTCGDHSGESCNNCNDCACSKLGTGYTCSTDTSKTGWSSCLAPGACLTVDGTCDIFGGERPNSCSDCVSCTSGSVSCNNNIFDSNKLHSYICVDKKDPSQNSYWVLQSDAACSTYGASSCDSKI